MAKKQVTTVKYRGEVTTSSKGVMYLNGPTPVGRVMYPSVFNSRLSYNGKKKESEGKDVTAADREYSVTLLFKKTDPMLKAMKVAIADFVALNFPELGKTEQKMIHTPVKDGNDMFNKDKTKYEIYKGMEYIVLKSSGEREAPTVLDEIGNEMMSSADMYGGCYAVAQVSFKAYKTIGRGITVYWSALKKLQDGEKLGGDRSKKDAEQIDNATSGISVDENGNVVYD